MLGCALCTYSAAIDCDVFFDIKRLRMLRKWIEHYEKKVKFYCGLKAGMFNNIANMYAKMKFDKDSVECFKKSFFYSLNEINHTIYEQTICFAFHSLSKHMLYNLNEETLNVSSPLKFNDIFDSPLIKLLDNDCGPSKLRRQALCDCLKIACFEKNDYLPTFEDVVSGKKRRKGKGVDFEYSNELLWSHYAEYHKGICIEYVFDSSLFNSITNSSSLVSFLKDVDYRDNIKSIIKGKNRINLIDGFFAKSKAWRYENELRFFYFNLNGSGDYESVKIPKCVKSITFGAQCPEKDKILVMKLMRCRKYSIKEDGKNVQKRIEFYQMEPDEKKFGKLIRKSIRLFKDGIYVKKVSTTP